jgi:sensor c-di-GMP phosphodiesterase-like protein
VGKIVKSKRNYLSTLITIFLGMAILTYWVVFCFLYIANHKQQLQNAQIITDTTKMIFEEDRRSLEMYEPLVDASIRNTLISINRDLIKDDGITVEELNTIKQHYPVTGIWIIEEDGVVRISTDGRVKLDARKWYKSRPDVNWKELMKELLTHEGMIWIDTYSKMDKPPYTYFKWGYMGIGEVKGMGRAILEIGVSVDDIKNYNQKDLKEKLKSNSIQLNENIVDLKIIRSKPNEHNDSQLKNKQEYKNGRVVNYVVVEDFNKSKTQMIVTTEFKELKEESKRLFVSVIIATLFSFGGIVCINTTTRRPKE